MLSGKHVIDDKDGIVSRLREAIHGKPKPPDVEFEEPPKKVETSNDNPSEDEVQDKAEEVKCDKGQSEEEVKAKDEDKDHDKHTCDGKGSCGGKGKCSDKEKGDEKEKCGDKAFKRN